VGVDYYAEPGALTELTAEQRARITELSVGPSALCRIAQGLLVAPPDASGAGLTAERLAERNLRPASALVRRALDLDPAASLDHPRPAGRRVVGTCRHYAVVSTAFLRAVGIPARARCGFATYFMADKKVDHWIVEIWSTRDDRWKRVDPEYLDRGTPGAAQTEDLRPGEFLTAGEAWRLVRSGEDDPASYGVFGTENWGAGEIRGNAMRDLASLAAKLEMLPWDEWGPMADSYAGATDDGFDELIDEVADATDLSSPEELQRVYAQLAVPASMVE
jgi:hypothetical protein